MTIENHMIKDLNRAIDNSFFGEDEKQVYTQSEVEEKFIEWFENQDESDMYLFEIFLESWNEAELLTFARLNRTYDEFKKWVAEYLQNRFEAETDLHLDWSFTTGYVEEKF